MSWLNFIWPQNVADLPNLFQRAARVGHWFCAAMAIGWCGVGIYAGMVSESDGARQAGVWIGLAGGTAWWLAGRAIRYVLGGE